MRTALLLTLGAFALLLLARAVLSVPGVLPAWLSFLLETVCCIAAFGGAAYLGLYELDGRQTQMIRRCCLSTPHILWLSLLGVLFVAPATLISDVSAAVLGMPHAYQGAPDAALFLPMLIKSALIAPVCEELFFRGYLMGVFSRYGEREAVLVTSLIFALMHGGNLAAHTLFGLLLACMMLHTNSLIAPALIHAAYNAALVLLAFSGLERLLIGLTPASCLLRILLCGAFAYVLRRAVTARGTRVHAQPMKNLVLSRRETALVAGAVLALFAASLITAGVRV